MVWPVRIFVQFMTDGRRHTRDTAVTMERMVNRWHRSGIEELRESYEIKDCTNTIPVLNDCTYALSNWAGMHLRAKFEVLCYFSCSVDNHFSLDKWERLKIYDQFDLVAWKLVPLVIYWRLLTKDMRVSITFLDESSLLLLLIYKRPCFSTSLYLFS